MKITGGLNVGPLLAITQANDPYTTGGNFSANVQVQNSSVFVLQILAGGQTFTIQPFLAQTIGLANDGGSIVITAIQNPSGGSVPQSITLAWLLPGESAPEDDGPLTAAAIAAAISGLVFTAQNQQVLLNAGAFNAPANNSVSVALSTAVPSWAQTIGIAAVINTPIGSALNQQLIVGTALGSGTFPDSPTSGWLWQSGGAGTGIFPEQFILAIPGDAFATVQVGSAALTGTITVTAYAAAPAEFIKTAAFYLPVESIGLGTATLLTARARLFACTLNAIGGSNDYAAYLLDANGTTLHSTGAGTTNGSNSITWPGGLLLMSSFAVVAQALRLQTAGTTAAVLRGTVTYSYE